MRPQVEEEILSELRLRYSLSKWPVGRIAVRLGLRLESRLQLGLYKLIFTLF